MKLPNVPPELEEMEFMKEIEAIKEKGKILYTKYFNQCILTATVPFNQLESYCSKQAKAKAEEEVKKEIAKVRKAIEDYLKVYNKAALMVEVVMSPWFVYCGKTNVRVTKSYEDFLREYNSVFNANLIGTTVVTQMTTSTITTTETVTTTITVAPGAKTVTVTKPVACTATTTIAYVKSGGETIKITDFPELSELSKQLNGPNEFYNELGKASGPLADEIKKVVQKNAWIIAQLSRISDSFKEFVKYLADFYKSEKELKLLLNQTATYDTVFKTFTLLQRMKVDLAMANKIVQEVKGQLEALKSNEPSVDYRAIESKIGPIEKFLLKSTKPMSLAELVKVKAQIASVGGTETLVKAYIAKQIDLAYQKFNRFYENWQKTYNKLNEKVNEYEEIAKYLSTLG